MHEIAFSIGSLQIHWYGIFAALGFLAASALLMKNRDHAGISRDNILDIGMIAMFAGIIGARIFYVIQFHRQFAGNWTGIFRIDKGGLVFYGGFLCALTVLFVYCRIKKIRMLKLLDVFSPALLCGHAFGRIGCFLQGCCFGKPCGDSPFGAVFPPGSAPALRYPAPLPDGEIARATVSLPLYPVQLFEAGVNLVFCGILLVLLKTKIARKPGHVVGIYFMGYGVERFCTELFRGDHTDFFFGTLTPAQTTGLFVVIPLGILLYFLPVSEDGAWTKTEK